VSVLSIWVRDVVDSTCTVDIAVDWSVVIVFDVHFVKMSIIIIFRTLINDFVVENNQPYLSSHLFIRRYFSLL